MPDNKQILRLPAVLARVGMGRSWVYREAAAGRFPAPIKIGRASGWGSNDIDQWVADRLVKPAAGKVSA
jgi:prophage regulatory protein